MWFRWWRDENCAIINLNWVFNEYLKLLFFLKSNFAMEVFSGPGRRPNKYSGHAAGLALLGQCLCRPWRQLVRPVKTGPALILPAPYMVHVSYNNSLQYLTRLTFAGPNFQYGIGCSFQLMWKWSWWDDGLRLGSETRVHREETELRIKSDMGMMKMMDWLTVP